MRKTVLTITVFSDTPLPRAVRQQLGDVAIHVDKPFDATFSVALTESEVTPSVVLADARALNEAADRADKRRVWVEFIEKWTHEGRLQTFEDRERFRAEAHTTLEVTNG